MSSYNPSYTLGGSSWAGNPPLVTKRQLLSTSAGLYDEILTINLSTISLSTLTVPDWISTGLLYVSDIQGYNVIASNAISTTQGNFDITVLSSLTFKGIDVGGINVSFDLGLGQAVGGLLGGLGALVGGGLIAVGTGAGLAIQGAEQGIATMIAGRPENYINNNVYETINFTSQLQISTLGSANPIYSTIFRTVSSVSANSVPGPEIFTSSFFYPGQICIRSASDPFNLITGDSNLNTSTIQSFGQWVPLTGLEPEDIQANSISTNLLSSGRAFIELGEFLDVETYGVLTSNIGVGTAASFAYDASVNFDLGSSGNASIFGFINQLNIQSDQPIVFSQIGSPGTITPGATLTLGVGAQSLFQVSSITASGLINANVGYFSSLIANELLVISTFSTIYNVTACNVLSTSLVTANLVSTLNLEAKYISPYNFSSVLGNPIGQFDINKYDFVVSTTYDQVSSLTQNILNYSLNINVQDEASFNIGDAPLGVGYNVTPQNIGQWASTQIVFNGYTGSGTIDLGWVGQWGVTPGASSAAIGGATFDILYTSDGTPNGYAGNFYLTEQSNQSYPVGLSTFYQYVAPPGTGFQGTWTGRMTLPPVVGGTRSGWWQLETPAPPPYSTSNNNTFQIYQDINDTYISATDRLHLQAGDILMDGTLTMNDFQILNLDANIMEANYAFLSTISTSVINASNVIVNPTTGGFDSFYYKSTISWNDPPQQVVPLQLTFQNDSPDFLPQYTLLAPFQGVNYFTSYNVSQWNGAVYVNTISVTSGLGPPKVVLGDLNTPLGSSYSGLFYINNSVNQSMPIYVITSAGSNLAGNCFGSTYMKIQTADGVNWTLTSNVTNPQGTGGSFSNVLSITQGYQNTNIVNTQTLQFQAPNVTYTTGNFNMYADQIRVNSHRYGFAEATGLPSYPIGIENNVYIDGNMSFSNVDALWQSDAANVLYNITNQIYYDYNSWIIQIIPSRFRTNNSEIVSWDVQPAVFAVTGSSGYCWGYNRYIQVNADIGGPGSNANNWNWYMAIPRNYCTYLS